MNKHVFPLLFLNVTIAIGAMLYIMTTGTGPTIQIFGQKREPSLLERVSDTVRVLSAFFIGSFAMFVIYVVVRS